MDSIALRSLMICLALVAHVAAEDPPVEATPPVAEAPTKPSVFELPVIQTRVIAARLQLQAFLTQKEWPEAEATVRQMMQLVPFDFHGPYNLACTLAQQGKTEEALAALEQAIDLGYSDVKHMQADDDLASLRENKRFKTLLSQAATAKPDPNRGWGYDAQPAAIEAGVALVSEQNTLLDTVSGMLASFFKFEKPGDDVLPVTGFGEAGDLVRKWYAEGTAAGNQGDLYDNHDRDHSNMDYAAFPQLAHVEFAETAKKRGLDHGLQASFLFNAPTLGNSSTAHVSGPYWRCQARFALTQPRGAQVLLLQYSNNHIYFYPEHRDHDPGHNGSDDGYGDVLPANTPYLFLSQGSSGSDRPLMHAVALVMAAFRPEVKAELVKEKIIAPVVQMIFRACYGPVEKPEDYLTGKAHPTAFDGEKLDTVRLVNMAHDMTLECLPPLAFLKVVEEDRPVLGIDYFDVAERERLFDTPFAAARVLKSTQRERRFVLSTAESRSFGKNAGDKPLKYHFVGLRGDPTKIDIKPLAEDGSTAEIRVRYHERQPVAEGSNLESNRVDIGVFAQNEKYYSPPAFLSLNYLDNERRVYNAAGQIESVEYASSEASKNYVDPLLDFNKEWRDVYQYDAEGKLLGWTRTRGETEQRFTPQGKLVTRLNEQGEPLEVKEVRYVAQQDANRAGVLKQIEVGETLPVDTK